MQPVISFKNINFSYQNQFNVLENISFEILANEFIGVVGPNGGGKTTLLKLITGLLKPSSGKISVFNKNPIYSRKHIGYVPQFSAFDRDFPITVMEVVLMGRLGHTKKIFGYSKLDKQIATEMLARMEIQHLHKKPINTLSGGQLQRVMIARALACKPKLLLLDEPTSNIDLHIGKHLFDLLKIINQEITILVVSHDIGFISDYISKVLCINKHLACHQTIDCNKDFHQLYEMPIKAIHHDHKD